MASKKSKPYSRGNTSRQSYPPPVQRSKQDPETDQHEVISLLKEQLKELNLILTTPEGGGKVGKSGLFNGWCSKMASTSYPRIGTVTHAVCHYFHGQHSVKKYIPPGQKPKPGDESPLTLSEARQQFVVSGLQESAQRGDRSHRILGRAFRILSGKLEREGGQKTMFIISQMHYDNLMGLIRQKDKIKHRFLFKEFPQVFKDPSSYINIEEINKHVVERGRGELDLMILHEDKGIILIQIKSTSREKPVTQEEPAASPTSTNHEKKIEEKVINADSQLKKDMKMFEQVVKRSAHWRGHGQMDKVKRVIAVPNLTGEDLEELQLKAKVTKGVIFLSKDDMMEESAESKEDPESEANLGRFEEWWKNLPDLEVPLTLDFIKEIIGKYIGPLSTIVAPKPGHKNECRRHFRDCIKYTHHLLACNVLSSTQRDILEWKTEGQRRVYISGPPGSGKTVVLVQKAIMFLEKSEDHQVMVVNMYRGAPGRAIGRYISDIVSEKESCRNRVHCLEVDVLRKNFVQEATRILEKNPEDRKDDTSHFKKNVENTLFIVDEIYIQSFWQEITDSFDGVFAKSEVWCAGLFSKKPTGFVEYELDSVFRCPPAVQNLLYHVDWDTKRKEKYRRDTECIEIPTNGPIPLCVRHKDHAGSASVRVIDCEQCAQDLASLLIREKLVKTTPRAPRMERTASDPLPLVSVQNTSTIPSPDSNLSVVILVNLPRDSYSKSQDGDYIETTDKDYRDYMNYVQSSQFIRVLIQTGIHVNVEAKLAGKHLVGGGSSGQDLMATWIYNFQGLETGVVIFLPGDASRDPQAPLQEQREIPTPGLRSTSSIADPQAVLQERKFQTPGSKSTGSASKDFQMPTHPEDDSVPQLPGQSRESGAKGGEESPYSLSLMQWRKEDVDRYSNWDKTNITVAGSRTLALLILMVS